jgi:hypothetical protein
VKTLRVRTFLPTIAPLMNGKPFHSASSRRFRVARISQNPVCPPCGHLRHNLSPLSFVDVEAEDYLNGLIGIDVGGLRIHTADVLRQIEIFLSWKEPIRDTIASIIFPTYPSLMPKQIPELELNAIVSAVARHPGFYSVNPRRPAFEGKGPTLGHLPQGVNTKLR